MFIPIAKPLSAAAITLAGLVVYSFSSFAASRAQSPGLTDGLIPRHSLSMCEAEMTARLDDIANGPAQAGSLRASISRLGQRLSRSPDPDVLEPQSISALVDVSGDIERLAFGEARQARDLLVALAATMDSADPDYKFRSVEVRGAGNILRARNAIYATLAGLHQNYEALTRQGSRKYISWDRSVFLVQLAFYGTLALIDVPAAIHIKSMFTFRPSFGNLLLYDLVGAVNVLAFKYFCRSVAQNSNAFSYGLKTNIRKLLDKDVAGDYVAVRSRMFRVPVEFHDLLFSGTNDPQDARLRAVFMNSGELKNLAFRYSSHSETLAAEVAHAGRAMRQIRLTNVFFKDHATGEPVWAIFYGARSHARALPPPPKPKESPEGGLNPVPAF